MVWTFRPLILEIQGNMLTVYCTLYSIYSTAVQVTAQKTICTGYRKLYHVTNTDTIYRTLYNLQSTVLWTAVCCIHKILLWTIGTRTVYILLTVLCSEDCALCRRMYCLLYLTVDITVHCAYTDVCTVYIT